MDLTEVKGKPYSEDAADREICYIKSMDKRLPFAAITAGALLAPHMPLENLPWWKRVLCDDAPCAVGGPLASILDQASNTTQPDGAVFFVR